jgi:DNA-directed RNA polymerase subunit RPC12/RpoP
VLSDDSDGVFDQASLPARDSSLSNGQRRLSSVLEAPLFINIEKFCAHCKQPLREEELLTRFEKRLEKHKVSCPHCKEFFMP